MLCLAQPGSKHHLRSRSGKDPWWLVGDAAPCSGDPTPPGPPLSPPQRFASALGPLARVSHPVLQHCSWSRSRMSPEAVALLLRRAGSRVPLLLRSGWQQCLCSFHSVCCFQVP